MADMKIKVTTTITRTKEWSLEEDELEEVLKQVAIDKMGLDASWDVQVNFNVSTQGFINSVDIVATEAQQEIKE